MAGSSIHSAPLFSLVEKKPQKWDFLTDYNTVFFYLDFGLKILS